MHELSIALSILDVVGEETDRLGKMPLAVHIKLGALAGVVKEALISAFQLASEGSSFDGVPLVIDEVSPTGWCGKCECERPISSVQDLTCVECGEVIGRIVHGQELELTGLEIDG